MRLAITGGTGFVGGHLLDLAVARGHAVRALTRRAQPPRAGIDWIEGALDLPESLARLVESVDAVIHVAGVVNGDREAFRLGNIVGTERMVDAAAHAGIARFVHVSSLSAREPALSDYGWSKCVSEEVVIASGGDWTIICPPAIYGPGERDILELFRMAGRGVVPLPPGGGRLSVIAVGDLCRLLLDCLDQPASFCRTYEPDDGRPGGWEHRAFARALGAAVGRRVAALAIPKPLLRLGAWGDKAVRGPNARLTPDRVAYFCHPDWTCSPSAQPPASLWRPETDTPAGLAETARWYRARGWLSR